MRSIGKESELRVGGNGSRDGAVVVGTLFKQGMRDKPVLAIKKWFAGLGMHADIASIRQQFAGIDVIGQVGL